VPAAKQTSTKKNVPLEVDHETILQTLLDDLQEGIIVCCPDGTITLFNKAATDIFGYKKSIQPGDSLYNLCLKSPVTHALNLLHYRTQSAGGRDAKPSSIQFINATPDKKNFLRCRLCFLATPNSSFVLFFEDVSHWYTPDDLLFTKIDEFRGPMTNLRAAVENLTEHPEMSPVMRSAFENVLVQESLNLTEAFASLEKACNYLVQTQSHLIEINSDVLFGFIANHFSGETVTFAGEPDPSAAVKVDSYGLMLVLEHLAQKIMQQKRLTSIICKAHTGKQFAYFDFLWSGEVIPTAAVESLLQGKIESSVGEMTVITILHSMGGDMWSQQYDLSRGILRLALPLAREPEK